ncbi:NADH-quinone oxidoreductase subunit K [Actinomadura bangladeshensis]|uniref:Dehydrogenase n=1 Tax=Actinomadura bangladeshensis TaxID=453573 RepID=A0A6L9QU95_9ACTN|nr:dehydrogenase [Actinomadura bangladeshensis]
MTYYPYVVAGVLFVAGLYGVATSRSYVHLGVCLNIIQSSTYLLLLAIGFRRGSSPPVTQGMTPGTPLTDPVVQALTLTDIVVSVVVLALVLSLALQAHRHAGTVDPEQMRPTRG